MINMIVVLLALLGHSATSFAWTIKQEFCFSDHNNRCYIVAYDIDTLATVGIYVPWDEPLDRIKEANALGIHIYPTQEQHWPVIAQNVIRTTDTSLADTSRIFADVPPEQWAAWKSGATCVGTAAGCIGGTYQTIATGGLAFWLAQITCGLAASECLDMVRNIEIWQDVQRQRVNSKSAKKDSTSGSHTTNISSTGREGGHTGGSMGPAATTPVRVTPIPSGRVKIREGACSGGATTAKVCRTF